MADFAGKTGVVVKFHETRILEAVGFQKIAELMCVQRKDLLLFSSFSPVVIFRANLVLCDCCFFTKA